MKKIVLLVIFCLFSVLQLQAQREANNARGFEEGMKYSNEAAQRQHEAEMLRQQQEQELYMQQLELQAQKERYEAQVKLQQEKNKGNDKNQIQSNDSPFKKQKEDLKVEIEKFYSTNGKQGLSWLEWEQVKPGDTVKLADGTQIIMVNLNNDIEINKNCIQLQQQEKQTVPTNWTTKNKSETELRKFYDDNKNNLDPIEAFIVIVYTHNRVI